MIIPRSYYIILQIWKNSSYLFKKLELAHVDTRIERHWGKRAELEFKDHMLNLLKG
jgi:hypothetical protein